MRASSMVGRPVDNRELGESYVPDASSTARARSSPFGVRTRNGVFSRSADRVRSMPSRAIPVTRAP